MTTQLEQPRLYIDGAWVDASGDDAVAVVNPATEEVIARVPQGSVADVDRAVGAARRAFDDGPWPRMHAAERSDVLVRFVQAVADRRDDLVDLIVAEAGCCAPDRAGAPVRHAAAVRDVVRGARRDASRSWTRCRRRSARAGSARARS